MTADITQELSCGPFGKFTPQDTCKKLTEDGARLDMWPLGEGVTEGDGRRRVDVIGFTLQNPSDGSLRQAYLGPTPAGVTLTDPNAGQSSDFVVLIHDPSENTTILRYVSPDELKGVTIKDGVKDLKLAPPKQGTQKMLTGVVGPVYAYSRIKE